MPRKKTRLTLMQENETLTNALIESATVIRSFEESLQPPEDGLVEFARIYVKAEKNEDGLGQVTLGLSEEWDDHSKSEQVDMLHEVAVAVVNMARVAGGQEPTFGRVSERRAP